jgi:hypothetical protein
MAFRFETLEMQAPKGKIAVTLCSVWKVTYVTSTDERGL